MVPVFFLSSGWIIECNIWLYESQTTAKVEHVPDWQVGRVMAAQEGKWVIPKQMNGFTRGLIEPSDVCIRCTLFLLTYKRTSATLEFISYGVRSGTGSILMLIEIVKPPVLRCFNLKCRTLYDTQRLGAAGCEPLGSVLSSFPDTIL